MSVTHWHEPSPHKALDSKYAIFLEALFGPDPISDPLVLFTKQDKCAIWTTSIEQAIRLIPSLAKEKDLYVSVALHDKSIAEAEWRRRHPDKTGMPSTRGYTGSARVLCGLHADIDVKGPAHAQGELPCTKEEALAFIKRLPVLPTLIIDTGWGFHVWWLFREPWALDTDKEREKADALSKRWQAFIN